MEVFEQLIESKFFKATNQAWNRLQLNSKWSIGFVSELIQKQSFHSKEEWEQFYYQSGRYRAEAIRSLSLKEQLILNAVQETKQVPFTLSKYNTHYGRTPEDLRVRAKMLYDSTYGSCPDLTLEICEELVRFRVVCDTWNGIMIRERCAIQELEKWFLSQSIYSVSFKKTEGAFDYQYEIDYECYVCGRLVAGIQVKPVSYQYNAVYLSEAKRINAVKNNQYLKTFKVPILYVFADKKGSITNFPLVEDFFLEVIQLKNLKSK